MILAAGRGERMGPLTADCPKPLLAVAGMPLIEYHLRALAAGGFSQVVINTAYLGDQIVDYLKDGARYGLKITWSHESGALGTGGGINNALPEFGGQPFVVINGDIWCDYPYASLRHQGQDSLAHLIMVANPAHNRSGDFGLTHGKITHGHDHRYTFSGIGVYRPELFKNCQGEFALGPLIKSQIDAQRVSGALYTGHWWDVGTVQRLHTVESYLKGDY